MVRLAFASVLASDRRLGLPPIATLLEREVMSPLPPGDERPFPFGPGTPIETRLWDNEFRSKIVLRFEREVRLSGTTLRRSPVSGWLHAICHAGKSHSIALELSMGVPISQELIRYYAEKGQSAISVNLKPQGRYLSLSQMRESLVSNSPLKEWIHNEKISVASSKLSWKNTQRRMVSNPAKASLPNPLPSPPLASGCPRKLIEVGGGHYADMERHCRLCPHAVMWRRWGLVCSGAASGEMVSGNGIPVKLKPLSQPLSFPLQFGAERLMRELLSRLR